GFYAFGRGAVGTNIYRLPNPSALPANNGLDIGSMPAGTIGFIDTSIIGQVNLLAIPEPTAAMLLALALGGLLGWRPRSPTAGATGDVRGSSVHGGVHDGRVYAPLRVSGSHGDAGAVFPTLPTASSPDEGVPNPSR